MRKWFEDIYYSFPIQLLILHLRSNLALLSLWIILALLTTGAIGRKLGLLYLFIDPEYLGAVNFWSFFFVGLAFGGFLMSWNLTTYLLSAHYFPFLASLSRPFTKFCLNNAILPLIFLIVYFFVLIPFQLYYGKWNGEVVFFLCLGFITGTVTLVVGYSIYFTLTNKDISSYESNSPTPPNLIKSIAPGHRDVDLEYIKLDQNRWKVKTYLNESFQPRLTRSVAHYDSSLLLSIFKQNHLNALIIQLLSMIFLLLLGYLIDFAYFRIPAGASVYILFSVFVAIIGAVTYWFNEWRVTIIIILLFCINYFTSFEIFNHKNKAYGLNFNDQLAPYSYETLQEICQEEQINKDIDHTKTILEHWKQKMYDKYQEEKPKMILLCVSGGGLKSASWSMRIVQKADSLLQGKLLDQTVLITGASGGMIGLSYLRELYYRKLQGDSLDLYSHQYIENISKDMLNSLAFTLVSNDLFLPWAKFETGGYTYRKDRGYIFDQQLNENTGFIFDKSLGDYREPEFNAEIPMMYITPSIVNDARRLVISPQGVSFMMLAPVGYSNPDKVEVDAVDFGLMFKDQDAHNLRFTTALRMNATYPYVLPNVFLPSDPLVEVLDAGFRDNYGILSATRFLQVFKDWILENTSGVIMVQMSSSTKIEEIMASDYNGVIESLLNPLGIAGRVLTLQEYEHDNSLGFVFDLLGHDNFDVIRFIFRPTSNKTEEVSISFHMTEREKADVLYSVNDQYNKLSIRQLVEALQSE